MVVEQGEVPKGPSRFQRAVERVLAAPAAAVLKATGYNRLIEAFDPNSYGDRPDKLPTQPPATGQTGQKGA